MPKSKTKAKINYNVHTRLPPDLYEQLTASAEQKGSSLSAEIRERLRLSLFHKRAQKPKLAEAKEGSLLEAAILREALKEIKSCTDSGWTLDVIRQVEDGTYSPWY